MGAREQDGKGAGRKVRTRERGLKVNLTPSPGATALNYIFNCELLAPEPRAAAPPDDKNKRETVFRRRCRRHRPTPDTFRPVNPLQSRETPERGPTSATYPTTPATVFSSSYLLLHRQPLPLSQSTSPPTNPHPIFLRATSSAFI